MNSNRNLLFFSPAARGGLADYAREQANALAAAGLQVTLLGSPGFKARSGDRYVFSPKLAQRPGTAPARSRIASRLGTVRYILKNAQALERSVSQSGCRHILIGAFAEYLAPLWAGPLRRLARRGAVFGAVVHDPVRGLVVGPQLWHQWSVAAAYSFLREAFVHEPIQLDTVRARPGLRITVIPHGTYRFEPGRKTPGVVRQQLSIPPHAPVLLSFGLVRDRKNLDLTVRALKQLPEWFLVVAGQEERNGQKPIAYYQGLAETEGVAGRCRWLAGFIPESEVGDLFGVADLVPVTYERGFRSASGVLNVAVGYRRPCVASSGPSNLQSVVNQYKLGVWVEPDSVEALVQGVRRWRKEPPAPEWERYEAEHSWTRNAQLVIERMFE